MEKNTPTQALKELREEMDKEIESYIQKVGDFNQLTGIFMSEDTLDILKQEDWKIFDFSFSAYAHWQKIYKTPPITARFRGFCFCGYIFIDNTLGKGKVLFRHYEVKCTK